MVSLRLTLLCLAISTGLAAAAQSAQQQAPQTVLHAESTTVVLDVVVMEKGQPVQGIDGKRFHVYDEGKEQPISFFEEHEPPAAVTVKRSPALPPHFYTNVPQQPAGSAVNILLLDGLNTPVAHQLDVRKQMVKYLATVKPGTMMAVFTLTSRLHMVQGFTSDSTMLLNALRGAKTNAYQSPALGAATDSAFDSMASGLSLINAQQADVQMVQAFQDDVTSAQTDTRVETTIRAMQQLARYLSAVPGRKNLMWFSSAFPIVLGAESSNQHSNVTGSYAAQMQDAAALLAAARVAVYPMDAQGLATLAAFDVGNDGLGTHVNDPGLGARFAEEEIAADTGGQSIFNTNDFSKAVAGIIDNGAHYYTVAYVPDPKTFHGEYHKLKVRIDDCSCQLAYRTGYYADPPGKSGLPQTNALVSAELHGAPPATQVLFQTRVLPATDPAVKDASLPSTPLGDSAATLKAPTRRFVTDLVVDPHTITFRAAPENAQQVDIEFTLIAYDADGRRVNSMDRNLHATLSARQYAEIFSTGVPVRLAIDVPSAPTWLVIAVHDPLSAKVGSLEVPLPSR